MLSIRRVSIALVVVAGAMWAVSSLGSASRHQASSPAKSETSQSVSDVLVNVVPAASEGQLLAARYHLRGRTERFFQRSTRGAKARYKTRYKRYVPPTRMPDSPAVNKVKRA